MAILNGTCGGTLQSSVDFGREELEDGSYRKVPIETIIREAVHEYAHEPYHNIIINNVDEFGHNLIQYRGDKDIYLITQGEDKENFFNEKINTLCFDGLVKYKAEDSTEISEE